MDRKQIIFLVLLIAFLGGLFLYKIAEPALFEEDEAKITEEAREILVTGDWLTLHLNLEPWFHKPPLYMWCTAVTFKLFAMNEFTARVWSAIFAIGACVATFFLGRMIFEFAVGGFSAIMLGTSLLFVCLSRAAFVDTPLTFFITLSMLFFLKAYEEKSFLLPLSALSMALAVMSKGPIGVILPGISIFVYLMFKKELGYVVRNIWQVVLSLFVFLLVATPWWIAEYLMWGKTFIGDLFGDYMVGIYTSTFQRHAGPFYFYVIVILLGMLPWSINVIAGIVNGAKKENLDKTLFLLVWAAVVFVIFSTAKTKVPGYILPIFPPLSILAAMSFDSWKTRAGRMALPVLTALMLVSVVFVIIASEFILPKFEEQYNPSRIVANEIKKDVKDWDTVKYYDYKTWFRASLVFYLERQVVHIKNAKELGKVLAGKDEAVIFTDTRAYEKIKKEIAPYVKDVKTKGEIVALIKR